MFFEILQGITMPKSEEELEKNKILRINNNTNEPDEKKKKIRK